MGARTRTVWHEVINGVNFSALIVVLFIGLPLYWLIISSFKTPSNLGASPPQWWPNPWSGTNYSQAFNQYDFGQYFISLTSGAVKG
jgi:multiple sugar transport system permease protein